MRPISGLISGVVTVALGSALVGFPAAASAAVRPAAVSPAICRSASHPGLAARLSSGIRAALRGRVSVVAVGVDDPGQGLDCWLNSSRHFDSASVVKVTILAALLREAMDRHRYLTGTEAALARAMITRSDNDAASGLWAELGHPYLRHFLKRAGMRQTILGPDGAWGLTQITAHDEVLLLRLLLHQNRVLDTASRNYALSLMAHVIRSQRWGVPVGAPTSLTVHLKNGWLPLATHGWRIHSIGCFTGRGGGYCIVVLTQDNPTMAYGIATVEAVAKVINHDLNPKARSVVPRSAVSKSWGSPDEHVPATSSPHR
jgi:beta-lactamase class A